MSDDKTRDDEIRDKLKDADTVLDYCRKYLKFKDSDIIISLLIVVYNLAGSAENFKKWVKLTLEVFDDSDPNKQNNEEKQKEIQ